MSIRTGMLTVFFEEPFWVGIFERVENGKLSVSKVTFGTEPKDYEIWEFVLKEYVLWSSIFVTLVAKKYHESVTLPSGLRMVYDNH